MQRKICHACGRQLNAYDHFCDGCGVPQANLQLNDAETIAAAFLVNRLKATSIDLLESRQGPEPNRTSVRFLVEDADERRTKFEVKVDLATKKVVTYGMIF